MGKIHQNKVKLYELEIMSGFEKYFIRITLHVPTK